MPKLHYNGQLQEIKKYPSFFRDKYNQILIVAAPNRFLYCIEHAETSYISHYESAVFNEQDELVEIGSKEAILHVMPVFSKGTSAWAEFFTELRKEPKAPQNTEMEAIDAD